MPYARKSKFYSGHARAGGRGLERSQPAASCRKEVRNISQRRYIVSLRSKPPRFRVQTALSRVLSRLLQLKTPTQQSSDVQIAVIKLPRSRGERTLSLPLKPKQPLLSTPSYMEIRLLSVILRKSLGKK